MGPRRLAALERAAAGHLASTWPRPWGRGDATSPASAFTFDQASTWPRPWGRGDRAVAPRSKVLRLASTWPRPWGRGDTYLFDQGLKLVGFNVAAAVGPRRCGRLAAGEHDHAASTWPRPWGRGDLNALHAAGFRCEASTWPRPWGRGDTATDQAPATAKLLQRGRGRGAAEISQPRREQERRGRASTWPRPWGRGDGAEPEVGQRPDAASTWPRPWGRGDRLPAVGRPRAAGASTWPRPWGRGDDDPRGAPPGQKDRFNVAAAVGPRRSARPASVAEGCDLLQRGRGRGAAEMTRPRRTGPPTRALQRGRGRGAAEITARPLSRRAATGFNVAAAVGPRRWRRSRPWPGS